MDKTRREINAELGSLIKNARLGLGLTQGEVAELVSVAASKSISQPKVSEHENGDWGKGAIEDYAAAYGHALRIPEEQMRAVLGFTPPGAIPALPTFEEMVRADSSLDEKSKEHIINQYGLLQAASRHNRAHPSAAAG